MFPTIEQCVYTPYYCEENIYKLAESLPKSLLEDSFAVFISNASEQCPLWRQRKGSPENGYMVCWDYHVILIYGPGSNQESLVYDFDTTNPFPVPFGEYFTSVFHPGLVNHHYVQQFRVVPGEEYLRQFSSDRSRMKRPDGSFIEPPPKYDCIQNGSDNNNLNSFISMEPEVRLGTVMSLEQLYTKFG